MKRMIMIAACMIFAVGAYAAELTEREKIDVMLQARMAEYYLTDADWRPETVLPSEDKMGPTYNLVTVSNASSKSTFIVGQSFERLEVKPGQRISVSFNKGLKKWEIYRNQKLESESGMVTVSPPQ
ncbi:hypothetical protein [Pseudomonas fluorescens]|uniref:hypothetical protein n=1 Tax=Pseudomonas TaxID=286 RepID=UPI003D00B03A